MCLQPVSVVNTNKHSAPKDSSANLKPLIPQNKLMKEIESNFVLYSSSIVFFIIYYTIYHFFTF